MMRNYCYLISCFDHDSCALKPLLSTSDMEIAVAFVHKEDNKESMDWNQASMNRMSSLPASYQKNEEFRNIRNFVFDHQPSSRTPDRNPSIESTYQELKPINADPPDTYPIQRKPIQNFEIPQPSNQVIGTRPFSNSIPPFRDFTPDLNTPTHESHSLACTPGPDRYFTTLRGGLNPGYFIETGSVPSMEVCKQYCCRKSNCDVALMQQERCYLVTCPREELCEDVAAGSSSGVSHIFREERVSVSEEDVNQGRNEVFLGRIHDSGKSNGFRDHRDDMRSGSEGDKRMYGFSSIHDSFVGDGFNGNGRSSNGFRSTREGIGNVHGNNGIHDDVGIHNGEAIVRDIDRVRDNSQAVLERGGARGNVDIQGDLVSREGEDPRKIHMDRKDTIPIGYRGNEIPSGTPRNDHDYNNEDEVNLLRDAIADIEKKKHLENEDESYQMRSTSDIPTPPAQSKTDFEKIIDEGRQRPLIFDGSVGKRQDSQQNEGLGDMASDILSKILEHRTHDAIESIWTHDKDPLQKEISKAKEVNTPEKIEKELHEMDDHVVSKQQNHMEMADGLKGGSVSLVDHGRITGNSATTSDLVSHGTPSDAPSSTDGALADQSKLIETLYNLVKENVEAKNHNSLKNQGGSHEHGTYIDNLTKERPNFEPHFLPHKDASSNKIIDLDYHQNDPNDEEDDYSDYFDQDYTSGNPNSARMKDSNAKKFPVHFRHKNRPKLRDNGDNLHYKDYDFADNIQDELDDLETPSEIRNNWKSGKENSRSSDQDSPNKYIAKHERKVGKQVLDQDLDLISDNLNDMDIQDKNDYEENNQINDDNFSEYHDSNQDYEPNKNFYNSLGGKRKLLHSHFPKWRNAHSPVIRDNKYRQRLGYARPDSKGESSKPLNDNRFPVPHSTRGNPLVFGEDKQSFGQENENLVMGELEKIEDEIADMKNPPKAQRISEHEILEPQNSATPKLETKDGDHNMQSVVDILAGLKDVSTAGFQAKDKKLNQTDGLNAVKSEDDKILKELSEIKNQIGNISKPKNDNYSEKSKNSSKMDDIGDEISELLGEDWLLDKRSRIPKPAVKQELQRGGWRGIYHDTHSQSVKEESRGKQPFANLTDERTRWDICW